MLPKDLYTCTYLGIYHDPLSISQTLLSSSEKHLSLSLSLCAYQSSNSLLLLQESIITNHPSTSVITAILIILIIIIIALIPIHSSSSSQQYLTL